MKKLLNIILTIILFTPSFSFATFSVPIVATSTTQGWAFPVKVNGVEQALVSDHFVATSTTATSTLKALSATNLANTSMTSGSIPFFGAGGFMLQNNANLFWDIGNSRLGIGTNAPSFKLHVTSANVSDTQTLGGASGGFNVSNVNPLYGMQFGVLVNGDGWIQEGRNDASATAYNLLLQSLGGNVGIGVSPSTKLSVAGNIYSTNGGISSGINAGGQGQLALSDGTAGGGQVYFGTGTTQALSGSGTTLSVGGGFATTYFTGGNVGIGTTTPLALLSLKTASSGGVLPNSGVVPTNALFSMQASANNTMYMGIDTSSPFGGWIQVADAKFGFNNNYPLYLEPNGGSVGIGTSSPYATLSVVGTMALTAPTAFVSGDSAVCWRATGTITVDSGVSSCIVSSKLVKHNIVNDTVINALARISKLTPVTFEYNGTNKKDIGLIAEDAANVDPRYAQYSDKTGKPAAINWSAITADLVKVVQNQQKEIDDMKLQIKQLKKTL